MSMLISLMAAAALAPADYPTRDVLTAFGTACGVTENLDATIAALKATGWQHFERGADTPTSQMLARRSMSVDAITEYRDQFRKIVAGRTLYVLLSQSEYGGSLSGASTDCQMFDFDARRALTAKEIEMWLGRKPESTRALAGGSVTLSYPGIKPGHTWFIMWFNPSTPSADAPFTGLSLAATVMTYEAD